jgi:hypothetical protein
MVQMANYTLWLSTSTGERLAVLDTFVSLEYQRVVNHTGHASVFDAQATLPLRLVTYADALPIQAIGRDSRLHIWRTTETLAASGQQTVLPHTQELDTETTWFVRRIRTLLAETGQRLVELGAVPAIDLLASRIVAYPTGSQQAVKSGPADDVIKAIVRENMGFLAANSDRDLSARLTVAPDVGLAPTVQKSFARRNLLDVLRELAEASAEAGTMLAFDIVSPTPERLEFRTFVGQRGTDHSFPDGSNPVVLSPDTGTLTHAERTIDYSSEATVVYAAGQGADAQRRLAQVSDQDRLRGSPFAWRERLLDARHIGSDSDLAAEARAALTAGRPRHTFQAEIVSRPGSTYGQHWRWGDRVTAVVAGEVLTCHIEAVQVAVANGQEMVRAHLRGSEATASALAAPAAAQPAVAEIEATYQQVQRHSLPAGHVLTLPEQGHMLAYRQYVIAGTLALEAGASLVIWT